MIISHTNVIQPAPMAVGVNLSPPTVGSALLTPNEPGWEVGQSSYQTKLTHTIQHLFDGSREGVYLTAGLTLDPHAGPCSTRFWVHVILASSGTVPRVVGGGTRGIFQGKF